MSETQFSSLSPNSSNDLEIGNHYSEQNELFDQETLSIASDKSVADLEDFNDNNFFKVDPFLSDFMKEENDDLTILFQPWLDNSQETNEMNVFFSSLSTENDLEDYLSVATDCLDGGATDLQDWDNNSSGNPISAIKPVSNKRASSPLCKVEFFETPLPAKQRRVEVSSHSRCDEWINKYHELPEKYSFKDSGMLDRRKTKHHKVLSEYDTDIQVENIDSKRNCLSQIDQRKFFSFHSAPLKSLHHASHIPLTMTSLSNKFSSICAYSCRNDFRRQPFIQYNYNKTAHIKPPIKNCDRPSVADSEDDLIVDSKSTTFSEVVEMTKIPAPLRMGKRVNRRGHRLSLWQYLMCLLDCSKYREYPTGIKWINRSNGVFHIVDSKQVATLWGQYKERREKMTYDSLARSLRHYYKKNLMAKINNRRLVYQIAQECLQWSSESFLKKARE